MGVEPIPFWWFFVRAQAIFYVENLGGEVET